MSTEGGGRCRKVDVDVGMLEFEVMSAGWRLSRTTWVGGVIKKAAARNVTPGPRH